MGNIQVILIHTVDMFFYLLEILIFVRIILSWLPIGRDNLIIQMLYTLTEPVLGPIREMMNRSPLGGGIGLDFSPVIALFVMNIIKMIIEALISFF